MTEIVNKKTITYEEARELARHKDVTVRQALAARRDINPEILYYLTEDSSPEVRRTIAVNDSAPRHADLKLARDSDRDVRSSLAEKIAKVAPDLSTKQKNKVQEITYEALEILTRDQAVRVRKILSETLKDVANAPPDLINRLARDAEAVVAGPVLEFSPVLTDEDLVKIIKTGPAQGGLGAIARRYEVNESVSDAISSTDDVDAIADLLSNSSAQIREETLDSLIDRAPSFELWHAPLVGRPKLSSGAATRMAHFLADNLIETLHQREDLDEETLKAVKEITLHRLDKEKPDKTPSSDHTPSQEFTNFNSIIPMAKRLQKSGKLDDEIITKAIHACDNDFVLAALTVRSGVSEQVVQKIFSAHVAKAIVALAWKANLPIKLAHLIQQRIARIMPKDVIGIEIRIGAKNTNAYPLSDDEMNWQIEFFNDLSRGKKA